MQIDANFQNNLDTYSNAEINNIKIFDNLVVIEYNHNGNRLNIHTTQHCLLAARLSVMPLFKSPLENLPDSCTSDKNHR